MALCNAEPFDLIDIVLLVEAIMNSNFSKLLDKEYEFQIGRKGQIRIIRIAFDKKDYHHLAGLHYLKDIRELKQDRGKVYDLISAGQITKSTVESSDFYDTYIAGRIDALDELETLLDSNDIVFRYNSCARSYSKIRFDYLLECDNTYIFLKEDGKICRCVSIFRIGSTDYSSGHTKWTLLRKIKTDNKCGIEEIIYERVNTSPHVDKGRIINGDQTHTNYVQTDECGDKSGDN